MIVKQQLQPELICFLEKRFQNYPASCAAAISELTLFFNDDSCRQSILREAKFDDPVLAILDRAIERAEIWIPFDERIMRDKKSR